MQPDDIQKIITQCDYNDPRQVDDVCFLTAEWCAENRKSKIIIPPGIIFASQLRRQLAEYGVTLEVQSEPK
jgi:hypothetical protein